jgi:hypothetical protein
MADRTRALIAPIAAATLLAGCAASQQARDVRESGFLGDDYALLRPGKDDEALLVYRNADAPWSSYDKIKLDPVTIWAGEGSAFKDFSNRQKLADTFYTMPVEELSKDFQMVDELGAGVLHVQLSITTRAPLAHRSEPPSHRSRWVRRAAGCQKRPDTLSPSFPVARGRPAIRPPSAQVPQV